MILVWGWYSHTHSLGMYVHLEANFQAVWNQWNGMVEWNTGMTFDPYFAFLDYSP